MIKGVIFDFDNTLYNYEYANNKALNELILKLSIDYNISYDFIKNTYNQINNKIKISNNCSNKFNKHIYIKNLLEKININIVNINKYIEIYNNEFNISFKIYDHVIDIFKLLKNKNIKIGILSNNIFHQQYEKLKISGLIEYIDAILTTDEIGEEKPNDICFLKILNLLKIEKEYIMFVGDNISHDIIPSIEFGFLTFLFNNNIKTIKLLTEKYIEFGNYIDLYNFLQNYFNTTDELIFLSKYFGQSNLNVQGPGGNISVKLNELIFIKSSGAVLGNLVYDNGYCIANNNKVIDIMKEKKESELKNTKIFGYKIPSMETFFHSFMEKYTVHIHFTLSNIFFCSNTIPELNNFPYDYVIIDYIPPGLLLSEIILDKYDKNINIYFLKNHGIIITNNSIEIIIEIYENIYKYFNNLLNNKYLNEYKSFDINKYYYFTQNKSLIIKNIDYPIYYLNNIKYCFPDIAIFIEKIIKINEIKDLDKFDYIGNIILYKNNVFICSDNLTKSYYIMEILDQYKILCDNNFHNLKIINDINYLQNMEQEKFRKI